VTLARKDKRMNEDSVLEIESEIALDEQSAAWRELVREIVRKAESLAWAFYVYLILRWAYDLLIFFSVKP